MGEPHDRSLQERVEQLESAVEEIQRMLKQLYETSVQKDLNIAAETKKVPPLPKAPSRSPSEPTETRKAIRPPPQPVKRRPRTSGIMWKSESWLKIVGIGLLLFGVGFLFKFSVDQGWITEPVRVGFGLVLGIGLFVIGIRIQANRQHFSQVLLGGSIAIFYITGFAAFQLYALVSHPIAFAFMVSVTLLAFFLSLRQHEAILSIIGAVGGLGTPFLLYTSAGSLPGLIAYTCLVLGGTSAIYMYRGWRSLLWTSVVGGWAVFLISYIHGGISSDRDRWILQGGIIFGWIAFWALPVIREVLGARNPARWSRPSQLFHVQSHLDSLAGSIRNLANGHVHILSVCTPLLTLALSWLIWSLSNETWGWIATGGAMIYGVAAGSLRRASGGKLLAYTQALVALLLLTIAFCLLLRGDALFFTDAITHGSSERTNDGHRRSVVYRYTPKHMRTRFNIEQSDALLERLTPERREIVDPVPVRRP